MTSPAITKSPDNQKVEKKSPTHSAASERSAAAAAAAAPESHAGTAAAPAPPSDNFSWLRIFKLADLMMKQGC